MLLEEQKGTKEKTTTAKKTAHCKSTANKSTIKKEKKPFELDEHMHNKIRKLECDIKSIKVHLQNSRSVRKSSKKSKSMVRLPR